MKKLTTTPSLEDIKTAAEAIAPFVHRTPMLQSSSINEILGTQLWLKCENFQKVGAFKMRGASCAVAALNEEEKASGIATHSSGNHAQAVALSAKMRGITAHIVMPSNAPEIKRKAVEGYGAHIYPCDPAIESRKARTDEVLAETGATFIHPYNNYNIVAGQATAALEILEEMPDINIIMAPVGGGGLMSGTALVCHYFGKNTMAVGAEPAMVDDAFRSLQSGIIETNDDINTIADGLRTNLGEITLQIIRDHVAKIILVSEESITAAMKMVWERMKIIIEPSGAVPIAAIMTEPEFFRNKSVAVIVSGGNVDLESLPF
ncbi:MAG: threonine/serine dehydratase [Saprospiraceae bacterium]|nr:threonine/serine dehydratase [Saprospiraceae bacterium]